MQAQIDVKPGRGRPKGSKNKVTIAREAVAEVLGAPSPEHIEAEIHKRGHALLTELERITLDPTQPVAARILAAKVALPFLLAKPQADKSRNDRSGRPGQHPESAAGPTREDEARSDGLNLGGC